MINIIRSRKAKLSLDMAPLIDIVFQLLIFFMLTTSFPKPTIKLTLPRASTGEKAVQDHLLISMTENGNMYIDNIPVPQESLLMEIKTHLIRISKKSVHIKADQNMPYHYFVAVMDIARQAGAQQIHIVHEESDQ